MARLVQFREQLTEDAPTHVPHFDPLDGGVRARCLLLLDSPGRRSADSGSTTVVGTGFVSRDNPDPTADNLRAATLQMGLPRDATVLWNTVPWYLGDANKLAPTVAANWHAAMPALRQLVLLLPELQVVILLGRKAERAEKNASIGVRFADRSEVPTYRESGIQPCSPEDQGS
ncbi:uracil-DNA glycosylase [Rhodoferax sp.]|uniref:uracil-DNA glycosylase n=1 Tax=Rhodoferax sp. TaxID=50421 RepID=UPI0034532E7F